MNADGAGPVNLTPAVTESAITPSFSPDGQRIAFTLGPFADHDIALINADGTGFINLTNTVGQREEGPDWESLYTCAGRRATIVGSTPPRSSSAPVAQT
jgi:Tol biopolymer transport system component